MADPFGANFSAEDAKLAEMADPNLNFIKIAQRVRQLRVDVDAVNADAASTSAVLAALAAADAAVNINNKSLTGCAGITAGGGDTFSILCETGQGAQLTASTGTKVAWSQTGIGFFGAAAVAQPSAPSGAGAAVDTSGNLSADEAAAINAHRTRIGEIITALQALGLMA